MKKNIYILLFLLCNTVYLGAQVKRDTITHIPKSDKYIEQSEIEENENTCNYDRTYNLEQNLSGGNKCYIGRDQVRLGNGFKFSPVQGSSDKFTGGIDEQLLININYQGTEVNALTRALDYNLPVGSTQGAFNVSPTGSATYGIPIDVPPGTAGMQPSLSFNYNSQGGNGIMGLGFALGGISSITRCPKNEYFDGLNDGINYDANDKFTLDGERLILVSGTYGADGAEYRTHKETFSKIISYGTTGKGPEYFKVWTPDGKILEYGVTENSKVRTGGNTAALVWQLNKITDASANYLTYTYHSDANTGECWLEKVSYTGNDQVGLTPYNEVKFCYENRDDVSKSYIAGTQFEQKVVLTSVKVYANKAFVREYQIKYIWDDNLNITQVNQIIETGSNGTALNSTVFTWGEDNTIIADEKFYNTSFGHAINSDKSIVPLDDNGDGLTDFITFKPESTSSGDNLYIYHANSSGTGFQYVYEHSTSGVYRTIPCDANDDGLSDVVLIQMNSSAKLLVRIANGANGYGETNLFNFKEGMYDHGTFTGDFNGDGRTDFLYYDSNNNWNIGSYSGLGTMGSFKLWTVNGLQNIGGISGVEINIGEFNADGKQELLVTNSSGSKIYTFVNNGSSYEMVEMYSGNFPSNDYDEIYIGDLNSDGLSDIIKVVDFIKGTPDDPEYYTEAYPRLFNGINFETFNISNLELNYLDRFSFGDYNGDGKLDIYCFTANKYSSSTSDYILLNQGNLFKKVNLNQGYKSNYIIPGDFNGDGKSDFTALFYGSDPADPVSMTINQFYPALKNQQITSIANGLNQTTQINYKPLTNPTVYTKTTNVPPTYGDCKIIKLPIYVVSETTTQDGIGGNIINTYKYEDAYFHKKGKGLYGFIKTTIENNIGNKQVSTNFYWPTYGFAPFEVLNYSKNESNIYQLISKTINNTWPIGLGANLGPHFERYYMSLTTQDNYDYLNQVKTIQNFIDYDNTCGKAKRIEKSVGSIDGTKTDWYWINEYTYQNIETADRWVIGLTATELFNKRKIKYGYIPRQKTTYTYLENGFLQTAVSCITGPEIPKGDNKAGDKYFITKTYEYDNPFGLNTKVTTTTAAGSRYEATDYDDKGRFVTATTNSLGHSASFEYEDKYGNITKKTDANNLSTTYTYNNFGILTETHFPDNTYKKETIHWNNNEGFLLGWKKGLYYSKTEVSGSQEFAYVFYNYQGNVNRVANPGFDLNNYVVVDKKYNNKGQLIEESMPTYFSDINNAQWINYTYYTLAGNIHTKTGPGVDITYTYTNRISTITDNLLEQTVTKTVDAEGNVLSSTDAGGTINYTYNEYGITEIKDPNNVLTTIEYDERGLKTKLTDPDGGIMQYQYNDWGELIKQIYPNNNIVQFEYDILGRMKKEIKPEGTIIYTYDTKPYALGAIASVDGYNVDEDYTYDNLGRVIQKKETLDGADYIFSTTYDAFGRVATTTYPSSFQVYNVYNENGNLEEVHNSSNNALIWKHKAENALGQINEFELGNGLSTWINYDDNHFPETMQTGTPATHGSVLNLEFDFNEAGQLQYRKDFNANNYFGLTENFAYDADGKKLNRLSSAAIVNGSTIATTYFTNGNIQNKTDVGDYDYMGSTGSVRPHAVKKIDNPSPYFPNTVQIINYTSFLKVKDITDGEQYAEFIYGNDQQRRKMICSENRTLKTTKYYFGSYEKETNHVTGIVTELHYIATGSGTAAVYEKKSSGQNRMLYIHTDYLGNILAITNDNAQVVEHNSFDAWGNRRDPNTWVRYNNNAPPLLLGRGYTGHEHLEQFVLINMNGRLYDPVVGRFLSPDNYVQMPDNTQSLNRYSYCLNNPLMYNDPSGEIWNFVIGALIGGTINWVTHGCRFDAKGLAYFGVGALAGALTGGIGTAMSGALGTATTFGAGFANGMAIGMVTGAVEGLVSGIGNALVGGANFGEALGKGVETAVINGIVGGMAGGVMGGIQGARTGSKMRKAFKGIQMECGDPFQTKEGYQLRINDRQKYLEKFSDTYYKEYIYKENAQLEYNPKCKTNAKTFYIDKENNLVKFGPSAFGPVHQPDYELYFTMGHEYIHVAHNMNGLYSNKFGEYTAYMWEVNQMKDYGFNQKFIDEAQNEALKAFTPKIILHIKI